MTKRGLILLLLLMALALPTFAQTDSTATDTPDSSGDAPTLDELTALARYFPADAPLFFSIRTDDDYIQTVNDLSEQFLDLSGVEVSETLIQALDRAARDTQLGSTFEDTFGWIGDTFAAGVINWDILFDDKPQNDYLAPYLFAFDVENRDAAADFLGYVTSFDNYDTEETDAYTQFTPQRLYQYDQGDPYYYISDDVLLITNSSAALPREGMESLADAPVFDEALASLPEPSYNAVLYSDPLSILDAMANTAIFGTSGFDDLLSAYRGVVSAQTWGFTIVDDATLIADVVQSGDLTALPNTGISPLDYDPVDPSFARYLPSGTPLVVHGSNFGGTLQAGLDNLQTTLQLQADAAREQGQTYTAEQLEQFQQAYNTALVGLRGATGLDLEDDVLAWMTGDYLIATNLNEQVYAERTTQAFDASLPLEFVFITEVTDADAAAALVEGIREGVELLALTINDPNTDFVIGEETLGGTEVITVTPRSFGDDIVELIVGADENVFVIGTRAMVQHALNPDGGLDTDAAYDEAQNYLVPESVTNAFVFADRPRELIDTVFAANAPDYIVDQFNVLFNLFDNASISAAYTPDGTSARFVLILPLNDE